jgi:hypothetical protein
MRYHDEDCDNTPYQEMDPSTKRTKAETVPELVTADSRDQGIGESYRHQGQVSPRAPHPDLEAGGVAALRRIQFQNHGE